MHMLSHLKMQHIHLLSNNTLAVSSKGTTLGLICSSPPYTSFFPAGDPSADAPTGRKPPGHHVGPDFQTAAITMLAEGDPTRKSLTQGWLLTTAEEAGTTEQSSHVTLK
jgi:hypothetical protein